MAFFGQSGSGTDSGNSLYDKCAANGYMDVNSSDKDAVTKVDDQSEEEAVDGPGQLRNGAGSSYPPELGANSFPSGRRSVMPPSKWGSSFWKDCQPMESEDESESKNADSDDKSEGKFDDNLSEMDGHNDSEGLKKVQADVPVEELSSDDYYEQDGEGQSDSLHYNRNSCQPAPSTSKPYSRLDHTGINKVGRTLKKKYDADDTYGDDDEYAADDDEVNDDEGEDGDDPDDADFEPDLEDTSIGMKKDEDWNVDASDEDDDDGNDDNSEEDDADFIDVPRRGKQRKPALSVKSTREIKLFQIQSRRKKEKVCSDDDISEKGTEEDTDEEFDNKMTRVGHSRKKLVGGHSFSASTVVSTNELRTSGRSVRKVSYAESEESEDIEVGKSKKAQKDEAEEDDGDCIEKVLWYQPKGTADDALKNNASIQPTVFNPNLDSDPDWHDMEFYIKWKGRSYLHCQWKCFSDLQNLSGFKKVINYTKRVMEERKYRRMLSREEAEVHDVGKEMELDLLKQYSQVERVFSHRLSSNGSEEGIPEYLVKWQGLSYAEATWEKDTDIAFAQQAIDEYKAREAVMTIQGRTVDFQRKKSKASLRRLDEQPDWLRGGKLRDYQLEGLNFLVNSWRNDTNVILADEMGLGKTVQSVSMLGFLQHAQQIHGPFIVVVPLSTLSNWAKEFRKWLPDMNVVVYVGNCASREVCQNYEFFPDKRIGGQTKFNTLLTTYEVLLKDKGLFSKIRWSYLMVDEAHRLKNCEASLYTTLSEFSTKNKLLITGTPLQNSVEELWALLHFLDPEKFKNKDDFVVKYKNLSSFNELELANLHKELRPHILRRVIKDVEKSLPPKIERILRVEMSPLQKQYYKWILERNFHDLNKGVRGNQVSLLNIVVELKKCCNHPFLFESADHGYGGDSCMPESSKVERIILSSGKLVILDKLLVRLRETNHRVLIFSQMVRMLDILAEYLSLRGFQFQRLDGSTRADLRHQAMEHFNAPGSEDFCFLLSTRAGGLGINLATADTVIIFDSDWNPQNDLQAMSRAHRIGQQEVVNIYRFVTSKSVEEDILERAKKKMVLDHLVIQKLNAEGRLEKKETKKGASMFDKNELSAILRFGAEELFKDEKNDEDSKKKLESLDIDEILERAEKVETRDAEGVHGNELLGAFKVANFGSGEDDATFWSRWIQPDAVAQAEDALAPRAARNTKSYAEDIHSEKSSKRKRGAAAQDRASKRGSRATDVSVHSLPIIEGAVFQVRAWSHGNLSKKDATLFARAVKKFGDKNQISSIVAEVGGVIEASPTHAQHELYEALINGCQESVGDSPGTKGILLDFFGVPVKAQEMLDRVHELQLLAKRIKRYKDPDAQFRLMTHIRGAAWSKGCGWNQVDDARLLLGIHYHGFGNWEKIRLDARLGLTRKIAPATLGNGETFLPRAPNLDQRASALLRKEFPATGSKTLKVKQARAEADRNVKVAINRGSEGLDRKASRLGDSVQKHLKVEPNVKEEGEVSDSEHYKQFREEKWREWCADIMYDEMRTLKRLEKLQTTSEDLPKEKVLIKIRKYLQLIGRKIDHIVQDNREQYKPTKLAMRLWNYVSTFSNLSGEKLAQIYSKLKQEHPADAVLASSHYSDPRGGTSTRDFDPSQSNVLNGTQRSRQFKRLLPQSSEAFQKDQENEQSEAWKRRRRTDVDYFEPHASNGGWLPDPNSAGILGVAPADGRYFNNDRLSRSRQTNFRGQLR